MPFSLLAVVVGCSGGDVPPPVPGVEPVNVLLVLADDVGADRLALYGISDVVPATPNLDALADAGITFTRAYAHPICSSSRAALLTGRHGYRHGAGSAISTGHGPMLPLAEQTLPELMDTHASSAIGKWHLANQRVDPTTNPNDQGFDWYRGQLIGLNQDLAFDGQPQSYFDWEEVDNGVPGRRSGYLTSAHVDDAIERMAEMPEPWITYVSFMAAHSPYQAPPEALTGPDPVGSRPETEPYNAMIEAIDTEVGRLLASMSPALRSRTVVIFAGDNGTPENATDPPLDPDRAKHTVYEGGVRIPFIVSGPPTTCRGCRSAALVHLVDIVPTLTDMFGIERDPGLELDGVSFLTSLLAPAGPGARQTVYTERFLPNGFDAFTEYAQGIRDPRYKLIRTFDGDALYDLEGRELEGRDLLDGPLTSIEQAAYDRLDAALPVRPIPKTP